MESDSRVTLDGIQTVVLPVHDVAASCSFYENTLGLIRVYENQGVVALDAGGPRILIHPSGPGTDFPHAPVGDSASLPSIYWNVNDVDRFVEAMKTQGVEIAQEPTDEPWGERDACLLDPDGYRIYVTQSKSDSWITEAQDR